MLEVQGLTKRFGGFTAVDGVSFTLERGEILGLIGPNGSGKSTSIDCVSGFQQPDAGRWFLAGQELTGLSAQRIARQGLVRTFQDVRAYDVVKDVGRLERFVSAHSAWNGIFVALTNEPSFWRPVTHGRATNADAFRIYEGVTLEGTREWGPLTGPGTMKSREAPIATKKTPSDIGRRSTPVSNGSLPRTICR